MRRHDLVYREISGFNKRSQLIESGYGRHKS